MDCAHVDGNYTLALYLSTHFADGFSYDGMAPVGREFEQWLQNEVAQMHTRMGNDYFAVVDFVAYIDYVDVEPSVGVGAVGVAVDCALRLGFDGVEAAVDCFGAFVGGEGCPDIIIGVTRRVTP